MTDLMCSDCAGKGNYVGTDITCRSCHGTCIEQDLIKVSRWEVLQAARAWKSRVVETRFLFTAEESMLLEAVVLLEAREAMRATEHLDAPQPPERDPDHLSPSEGGNRASDD